jgi:hypothetical protein
VTICRGQLIPTPRAATHVDVYATCIRLRHLRVYATRGYATRVHIRHPGTCTPLEYVTYVELQHTAAAVQAWGCVDATAPHACTPLAGTPLEYIYATRVRDVRGAAAAVQAWSCVDYTAHHACTPLAGTSLMYVYAIRVHMCHPSTCTPRGHPTTCTTTPLVYVVATHVRCHHVAHVKLRYDTQHTTRGACTCAPLEYGSYVELQHAAAAVHAWCGVDDTAHHACTPLAGTSLVYVYAIRVRVRHSSIYHWWSNNFCLLPH